MHILFCRLKMTVLKKLTCSSDNEDDKGCPMIRMGVSG